MFLINTRGFSGFSITVNAQSGIISKCTKINMKVIASEKRVIADKYRSKPYFFSELLYLKTVYFRFLLEKTIGRITLFYLID